VHRRSLTAMPGVGPSKGPNGEWDASSLHTVKRALRPQYWEQSRSFGIVVDAGSSGTRLQVRGCLCGLSSSVCLNLTWSGIFATRQVIILSCLFSHSREHAN
jgi:hypothetical protein